MPKTGRRLHHDPQSWDYEYHRRLVQARSVHHRLGAPALDQDNLSACTGFAGAQWLNCRAAVENRKRYNMFAPGRRHAYLKDFDGRWLYSQATKNDFFPWVWPEDDGGSSGLGVAKALLACGAIERYEHTFSFTAFLGALQRQPVLLGTVWPNSMFDPDLKGIIRATTSLDIDAGHEYLAYAINWPQKLVRIRNSWGSQWGLNGDAYIPFSDMERLLAAQGDCTVPIVIGQ
jgi:hypothetical protein